MIDEETTELQPWDLKPGEPRVWFLRFQRYYLYRGLARSLRKAFATFLQENYPDQWEDRFAVLKGFKQWQAMASRWQWQERAMKWDQSRNKEVLDVVEASRQFLKEHSINAAQALVEALDNGRLQVAAANSILDRAGIPPVQRIESYNENVELTADDLASAQEEVDKWKQSKSSENGQPAS